MPNIQRPVATVLFLLSGLAACGSPEAPENTLQPAVSPVAADILFLVLGKMSLYDQAPDGDISLRDHHFVAEIMPKEGREIISGTLTNANDESQVLEFKPEGNAFLAHGLRTPIPEELHQAHPDGEYNFSYQTQSGRMDMQPVSLEKRASIEQMPMPAAVTLSQNNSVSMTAEIDPNIALTLAWEPMPGNTRVAASDLDDLIFVLVFDCFGNNIAHSGRPYQGGPYLTYKDSKFTVRADDLNPGQTYTAIVEQATADVTVFQGVPGIATYATLTFLDFQTSGLAEGRRCQ